MAVARTLTGVEQTFADDEIIVSKTDTSGRITYANDVFLRICGYREDELLDQPHSMIRHPDMPRAVFKLLWDRISSGGEIFAFVVNCCRNGDHYWVLAHVTPDFDEAGRIVGYHSSRRLPKRRRFMPRCWRRKPSRPTPRPGWPPRRRCSNAPSPPPAATATTVSFLALAYRVRT